MEDNKIPQLIARYRVIKAQTDALKRDMDDLRAELRPLVAAADGKWKDNDGYARLVYYQSSVSFETKAVNNLVKVWCDSTDPVMKACGEMLRAYRKERGGHESFQIK